MRKVTVTTSYNRFYQFYTQYTFSFITDDFFVCYLVFILICNYIYILNNKYSVFYCSFIKLSFFVAELMEHLLRCPQNISYHFVIFYYPEENIIWSKYQHFLHHKVIGSLFTFISIAATLEFQIYCRMSVIIVKLWLLDKQTSDFFVGELPSKCNNYSFILI